ncbi:MAG TPA: aminotransferase class V-fold PLP-dependent enzyme [Opitutaceae bacterium]|nr:aminotransferase class V-fold PLP-dependent enzyme [Opitutaceae bacterium]
MYRRSFLETLGKTSLALPWTSILAGASVRVSAATAARSGVEPDVLARDEAFWREIAAEFSPAADFINLEYGYYHAAAVPTLEAELRAARDLHRRSSRYKRTQMREDHEAARLALASLAGVSPEEVAVTRNATESINTVIQGLDLMPGEEIVYSNQDYGSVVETLEQKAKRFGVMLREIALPLDPSSDEEVVQAYLAGFTPRTKLVVVTQMINLTGQVLPVRAICDAAHARGVEVLVDAAHAFAHVDTSIAELNCDYLGTSLHKWLCSPLGMGLLYVKREKISKVWPFMADMRLAATDIRKFEQLGTRPESAHRGILTAIEFHRAIGGANKLARLRYLHATWAQKVRTWPRARVLTPREARRHGAVGTLMIEGVDPKSLAQYWFNEHRLFTAPLGHPVIQGVRVTPGVPTPIAHIDLFVEAVQAALARFT